MSKPQCPEVNVMWKRFISCFLLPFVLVLGMSSAARAADITPVEGRDYWIQSACDVGTCVKIAPDINLNTPLFAEKLGVRPIDIRRDNPTKTIALCHRPGDGYRMGEIKTVQDRASDEIWKSCPNEADQYVYILPGQVIRITGVKHLSFRQVEENIDKLKRCKEVKCVVEIANALGAKIPLAAIMDAQFQTDDPLLSKLRACQTAECAVEIAREAGASIELSEGDKLLIALKLCKDDACKQAALAANHVGLDGLRLQSPPNVAENRPPERQAPPATVVTVGKVPSWTKLLIVLLSVALCAASVMCYLERFVWLERKIKAVRQAMQETRATVVQNLRSEIANKDERLAKQADDVASFKELCAGFLDFAKHESIPVPLGTSTKDAWLLIGQYFRGLAVENGNLRNGKLLAEHAKDEALRLKAQAEDALRKRVDDDAIRDAETASKFEELHKAKSSLDDWQRNQQCCRDLFARLSAEDARIIALDDEVTDLVELNERKIREMQSLEDQCRDSAALRAEVVSIQERITALVKEKASIEAALQQPRQEFEMLLERVAGFKLGLSEMYNETQCDRNEAALALGEARAALSQAAQIREAAEAKSKEREATAKAEADAHFAERTAALDSKIDELANREAEVQRRENALAADPDRTGSQPADTGDGALLALLAVKQKESVELLAAVEKLRNEKQVLADDVERLSGELEQALLLGVKTPSPVPKFKPNSVAPVEQPRKATMPYSLDQKTIRLQACDEFYGKLGQVLALKAPIVVDTPLRAWLLHDFMRAAVLDIRLPDLFPEGPLPSHSQKNWEILVEKFKQAPLEKVTYVVTELQLLPPTDYTPLALAGEAQTH